jgi:hypothetical protein
MLHFKLEEKEWFKCTIEDAIAAIQAASTDFFIPESYLGVEQQNVQLFRSRM